PIDCANLVLLQAAERTNLSPSGCLEVRESPFDVHFCWRFGDSFARWAKPMSLLLLSFKSEMSGRPFGSARLLLHAEAYLRLNALYYCFKLGMPM
ncbi:MAG: hypothetical protein WBE43_04715, partial [Candidatus Acidiferrales bacterium]